MAQVNIHIPSALRAFCSNQKIVEVSADTVSEALDKLAQEHDGLLQRIFTSEQQLRPFVNVFVNRKNVRSLDGLATPLPEPCELSIVPPIAGG